MYSGSEKRRVLVNLIKYKLRYALQLRSISSKTRTTMLSETLDGHVLGTLEDYLQFFLK